RRAPGEPTRPGTPPEGVLWQVACAGEARPREVLRRSGADFGQAAVGPDRRTLFFTGPRGVEALDLGTLETRPVTETPPAPADCWARAGRPELYLRDVVEGIHVADDGDPEDAVLVVA